MISIILSSMRVKETHIIQTAFEQYGYDIVSIELNYDNYLKCLQIKPDIYLVDIQYACEQEMKFIKLLSSRTHNNAIIFGYGPRDISQKSRHFDEGVFNHYFSRPLKFSEMLEVIKEIFPEKVEVLEENMNAIHADADIRAIHDSSILPSVKLSMIVQHASHFLAFPFTLPKVLAITNDPMSGAGELAKTIETDPVIAAHILKTANTVFYAPSDHRVTKMKDAIVRIGFNETKRVVLCIEVMKLFENKRRNLGFDRSLFWLHSISVAVATEFLFSRNSYQQMGEHAFLTGLLHDLGTIVLDEFLPDIFNEVLEKTVAVAGEFSTQFNSVTNFRPHMIAREFMHEWNFHSLIIDGISFKDNDLKELSRSSTEGRLQSALLVAHTMVKSLNFGRSCDQFIDTVPSELLQLLEFNTGITNQMLDKIYHKIKELCRFLKIAPKGMSDFFLSPKKPTTEPDICFFSVAKELFSPHLMGLHSLTQSVVSMFTMEQLNKMPKRPELLVLSLDDSSPQNAVAFIETEEYKNHSVNNCLIITSHVTLLVEKCEKDENTVVIPSGIDIRILKKIITAYFPK